MIRNAVHISHEAIKKVGGIGAVLHGLISSDNYRSRYKRTLLYGPLFDPHDIDNLGGESNLLFASDRGVFQTPLSDRFLEVEERYGVRLYYGKKILRSEFDPGKFTEVEVVALHVWEMKLEEISKFKYLLWENFSIDSMRYEHIPDYEQYVRIAVPFIDVVGIIFGEEAVVHFGHEYMGVPSLLAVEMVRRAGLRQGDVTIFYAHEISPARNVVESIPGHDVAFYNLLEMDIRNGISFEDEFGDLSWHYRSVLIKQEGAFDYVFAVGDYVAREYRYLVPSVNENKIKVVYNGIPVRKITKEDKRKSRRRIEEFCRRLYGFTPDLIFTHVARLIVSKGIWRDFKILYHLDSLLKEEGLKACYILLSSLIVTGRSPEAVAEMEKYGWPLKHRKGWPDLVDTEVIIGDALENLNMVTLAVKGVFINQFGFSRERIGHWISEDTTFLDLRVASDLEFGQSVYEPFGIAPLEVLPFGGMALISSASGAAFFLKERLGDSLSYKVIDYIFLPPDLREKFATREALKGMSIAERDIIEDRVARENIFQLFHLLLERKEKGEQLLELQQEEAEKLDWEGIAKGINEIV